MTSESCNVRKLLSLVKNNSNMITVNMLLILILLLLLLLNQIKSIHYTSGVSELFCSGFCQTLTTLSVA